MQTVLLQSHFDLHLFASMETPLLMVLRPRTVEGQWVMQDEFQVVPDITIREYLDGYGNRCQRLVLQSGTSRIHGSALVRVDARPASNPEAGFLPVQSLPDEVIRYLLPSRYCESDRLGAKAWDIARNYPPGYPQVQSIAQWLRDNIDYRPGQSMELIGALEVLKQGYGVCRDLAHLGIALCRSLSIPARFVSGYLEGLNPMDLHAWFEVWLEGGWYAFDPVQEGLDGGRLVVGAGRDGSDVPIFTQFGPPVITEDIYFDVRRTSSEE
ncbi:transglutaminase-like domain-containing protein [Desulfurispira natronophila]|uniref:Transglutaminase-like putative cysteine protease n=1 Tax=Desulfurispira natronophila TaxID=682562 RepID=A0A7W7Y4W7_9BACT|nr:transglutaminase family protein [Desulfurispira natronophila]MBB5022153.1 transglutaminase-like putative cysteine protease [Desulfurispira natronophila]